MNFEKSLLRQVHHDIPNTNCLKDSNYKFKKAF